MSRFPSPTKTLFASFALIAAATASIATAQTPITTANYSLTLPAGWTKISIQGQNDSEAVMVMNMDIESEGFLVGVPHQGAVTAAEMADAMKMYGAQDSLTIVAQGTKTLGGKSFSFLEFKQANPATATDSTDRFRAYFVSQGTFLFEAVLMSTTDNLTAATAQFEAALATLNLTASAHLRAVAGFSRPGSRPANQDILGRFNKSGMARTPLFRVTAR